MKDITPSNGPTVYRDTAKPLDKFSAMDEAVDKMCKSLEQESHKWVFDVHTFNLRGSSTEYWDGISNFADVWTGRNTHRVFSDNQKMKIKKSYDIARANQASVMQQRVLKQFLDPVTEQPKKSMGLFDRLKSIFWDVK